MHPTALADQLAAATHDARTRLDHIAHHTGARPITPATVPEWLHGHLRALRDAIHSDHATYCPHLATGPTVAYAAIWKPAILTCAACAATVFRADHTEDTTCDRCRTHTPDTPLHPGLIASGPVLLAYGLCIHCHTDTHPPLFQRSPTPHRQPHPASPTRPCNRRSTRTRRKDHR